MSYTKDIYGPPRSVLSKKPSIIKVDKIKTSVTYRSDTLCDSPKVINANTIDFRQLLDNARGYDNAFISEEISDWNSKYPDS